MGTQIGQPLRRVVRRERKPGRHLVGPGLFYDGPDEYVDELECGHTVTRYTDARQRQCPQCKAEALPIEDPLEELARFAKYPGATLSVRNAARIRAVVALTTAALRWHDPQPHDNLADLIEAFDLAASTLRQV